jgi:anaerobic selenocysteine-containing dehydrogenase
VLAGGMHNGPAAVLVGWGLARRRYGGTAVRFIDALSALSGNLGIAGGGVSYYFRRRFAFDDFTRGLEVAPRSFSETCMGRELLAACPPVKAMWITAANPAAMLPDSETVRQALRAIDFLVVVDTHPTDTTDLADLVLPTLTLLEDDDLLGSYGNHFLRVSRPTVEPAGESRHELWIWQQLARRLGLGSLLDGTTREWKKRMTARLQEAGVTLEQLESGPTVSPFASKVLFEGLRFPTASGKMQLVHDLPAPSSPDPEYPLTLMAGSTPKSQSSQWSVPPAKQPEVRIHPSAVPGLTDAMEVWVESRQGRLRACLKLDEAVHPSLAFMAKGQMLRQGACSNALVRAQETDLGGGAAYYDEPVRVTRA